MGGFGGHFSGPPHIYRKLQAGRAWRPWRAGGPKGIGTLSAELGEALVVHGALPLEHLQQAANGRSRFGPADHVGPRCRGGPRCSSCSERARPWHSGERREGGVRRGERSPARGRSRAGRGASRLVATYWSSAFASVAGQLASTTGTEGRGARRACLAGLSAPLHLAAVSSTSSRSAWKFLDGSGPVREQLLGRRRAARPHVRAALRRASPGSTKRVWRAAMRARRSSRAAARGRRAVIPPSPGHFLERGRAGDQLLDRRLAQRLPCPVAGNLADLRRRRGPAARSP